MIRSTWTCGQQVRVQGDVIEAMTDSQHWRECKRDFEEYNTKQNRSLGAKWDPLMDVWTFIGPGAGGEPEETFKSLAKKAAKGLQQAQGTPECDGWKVWLDTLRNENRNFDAHLIQATLRTEEWDKFALPDTK